MDVVALSIAAIVVIWGMASIAWFMGKVLRELHGLREDNARAASALVFSDEHITRRVEEQNMHSVLKRLDELEEKFSNQ